MSITSLIFGITSIILSFIPGVGIVSIVPIIFSLIFGIVSLVKMHKNPENKDSKAPSVVGIALSLVALVVATAWTIVIYMGISYFQNYEDDFTEMLNSDTKVEDSVESNEEIENYKEEIRENLE